MRKLIAGLIVLILAVSAFGADQRLQYNEFMVGAGHPTLSDTLNRLTLIEHNSDGSHKDRANMTVYGSSIQTMLSTVGSSSITVVVSTPITVDAAYTITSNISIQVVKGGSFVKSGTGTLTINGPFEAGLYTVFSGFSAGNVTFGNGSVKEIYSEWWGALSDGVSTGNDVFINLALVAANGKVPVVLLPGTYLCSNTIYLNIQNGVLRGKSEWSSYGAYSLPTNLKWTAGTIGISRYDGATAVAYGTVENIEINGNSVLEHGIDAGFFTTLKNVTSVNNTISGVRIRDGQNSLISHCSFNSNQDGLLADTTLGTVTIEKSAFRQNTRYGMNLSGAGVTDGGASNFRNNIYESNTSKGLRISGAYVNLLFQSNYYEGNDGNVGHHQDLNLLPFSGGNPKDGVVFDNDYYSTVGTTAVATIAEGKIKYRDCSLTGGATIIPVTITGGANVIFEDSFTGFGNVGKVRILPETVKVTPESGINFSGTGYLSALGYSIAFGSGDFTVSTTFSLIDSSQSTRTLFNADTNGLTMQLVGDANFISVIAFFKQGASAFHTVTVPFVDDLPYHLCYVRTSNVGYVYINGVLVESFADANDYTGVQAAIGSDGTTGSATKMYAFSYYNTALTATQVNTLWKFGGNPIAAALSTGLTFNLAFDFRPSTKVYETVAAGFINFTGDAVWLHPSSPMPTILSAITNTPTHTGQFAVVGGEAYISTGITATTDWKKITP